MAQKPEDTFRAGVHRYKPKRVYQEKQHNVYRGGIPDDYYEGDGRPGTLRVEYKYAPRIPKVLDLLAKNAKPALSKLQRDWLNRAYRNGQQVAVIIGTRAGGIILTDQRWEQPITKDYFEKHMKSRQQIMKWIERQVTQDAYKRSEKDRRKSRAPEQDAVPIVGHIAPALQDGECAEAV